MENVKYNFSYASLAVAFQPKEIHHWVERQVDKDVVQQNQPSDVVQHHSVGIVVFSHLAEEIDEF